MHPLHGVVSGKSSKKKRSNFTKGRTVADRRKSGMRAAQKCSWCRKKAYNSDTKGWVQHNSIVNCPFKTRVLNADLEVVCGAASVEI